MAPKSTSLYWMSIPHCLTWSAISCIHFERFGPAGADGDDRGQLLAVLLVDAVGAELPAGRLDELLATWPDPSDTCSGPWSGRPTTPAGSRCRSRRPGPRWPPWRSPPCRSSTSTAWRRFLSANSCALALVEVEGEEAEVRVLDELQVRVVLDLVVRRALERVLPVDLAGRERLTTGDVVLDDRDEHLRDRRRAVRSSPGCWRTRSTRPS